MVWPISARRAERDGGGPTGVTVPPSIGRGTTIEPEARGAPGFTDGTPVGCERVFRIGTFVTGQTVTVASCIWPQCGQRTERLID